MSATVVHLALNPVHGLSKHSADILRIEAAHGVVGDAHAGATVKHRSRVAVDPTQPNLRQVHLMHAELFEEVGAKGFSVRPGDLGENITTRGIDLLALPRGAILRIGAEVRLEVTGLRNPCPQIESWQPGLLAAVLPKDSDGNPVRKTGIMSTVLAGGEVRRGDPIEVTLPPTPHHRLERV